MDRNSLDADKNWIKDLPAVWKLRLLPVTNVFETLEAAVLAEGVAAEPAVAALVEAGALEGLPDRERLRRVVIRQLGVVSGPRSILLEAVDIENADGGSCWRRW
jgi:hypothetical protein